MRPTLEDIVDVDDSGWREMLYVGSWLKSKVQVGLRRGVRSASFLHVKVREGPIDLNDPGYFLIPERK